MIRPIRLFTVSILSAAMLVAAGGLPVLARSRTVSTTGNDISWPQCGGAYPAGQAFGIVGLNGGLANTLNACFASELAWAAASSGTSTLPRASLYVNTADPGQVTPTVADWPTTNVDPNGATEADPYGACSGADDRACAWQYGWDRAIQDMLWLIGTAPSGVSNVPSSYSWWLDVETGNSWETGTAGLQDDVADLEGMVAAFETATETASGVALGGVTTVGIYSTAAQWGTITGGVTGITGDLAGLPDWIPGARTQSAAQSNCSLQAFTGGRVLIAQWFAKPYDDDLAC